MEAFGQSSQSSPASGSKSTPLLGAPTTPAYGSTSTPLFDPPLTAAPTNPGSTFGSTSSTNPQATGFGSFVQTGSAMGEHSTTPTFGGQPLESCAICLGSMKPGQGDAIFTAECSHAFHFHCIASNVSGSNQLCPVCRAKWKDVPSTSGHPPQPQDQSQYWRPSPQWSPRPRDSPLPCPEPNCFDDDESLGCQSMLDVSLTTSGNVDVKIYPEVSAIARSNSQENFPVLIHLKAPAANANANSPYQNSRVPVDLVTVLDVSGSMSGNKLAMLKRAMEFMIQNLGSSDRLSIISFSSTATRLCRLLKMTDSGKQQALEAVNILSADGGTNIAKGLTKATKVLEERREKNPVSSIMLLSDGQDNYANTCEKYRSLLPFSVFGDGNTCPIHAFGFGADHDAPLMHYIAEMSRGTFSFIELEGTIQDAFAQCLGGLLSVVMQDLRVDIKCVHPDVRLSSLKAGRYRTYLSNDARLGFIEAGDFYADEERDFLIAVSFPASDLGNEMSLVNVHCEYRNPISKETSILEGKDVKIERPDIVREQVVSLEVDRQKNRVRAAEAISDARAAAEKGDFPSAMSILEGVRNLTLETPSAQAGDKLCAGLDAELKEVRARMASGQTYNASGRAFALSAMSSHTLQRAGAGGAYGLSGAQLAGAPGAAYQTKAMRKMVRKSKKSSDTKSVSDIPE